MQFKNILGRKKINIKLKIICKLFGHKFIYPERYENIIDKDGLMRISINLNYECKRCKKKFKSWAEPFERLLIAAKKAFLRDENEQ
jgi:hypothetical protein